MMIKLFGQTDKLFSSNGDIVLNPKRAKVRKEDNGSFYLDLDLDLTYVNDLTDGRIIVAPTPQGDQAFRISNPQKTKSGISTRAYHVFYDSMNLLIEDSYVDQHDCNYALDHLNAATSDQSPFTTISDITTVASYRCVRTSLHDAVMTVIDRWGGHLVRDNFNIGVMYQIGTDNGVTVRYRKNLKEITCDENWDQVVTKLLPVGKDGIMLNSIDSSAEKYLYSSTQYALPYTKTVSFTQDGIVQEDYADETSYQQALIDDLRQQGQAYVDANCVPQVNYTLRANLEKVTDIGDTVEVIDERLGINLMTSVIAYEYDCILGKYTEVEFGNFKQTLSGLVGNIQTTTEKLVEEKTDAVRIVLDENLKTATDRIWSVLGDSYVIDEGDKILIVDSLPKETAQYVIMLNSAGIGFSNTGINGVFNSVWQIDGTFDAQAVNVINLTANLIKGGTLKLGSNLNESGILEVYDSQNNLIGVLDKDGLRMYGIDGSYVLMNSDVGFAGFDRNGTKIYWVSQDEFHMRKSVVEEEITLCNKMRFIPITIYDDNQNIVNDGIGLVSVAS